MAKKVKMNKVFSKDFIKGFKAGLQVAKDVAKRQGYEIHFPDIEEIQAERCKKK